MKIRIKGNSIRLRLTRPEVEYFGRERLLEESTSFGSHAFRYRLSANGEGNSLRADFSDNAITLYMPPGMAAQWVESETVGYSGEMDLPQNKKLYLLVEKDFKCLDNTIEDQSDNYPNPLAGENG